MAYAQSTARIATPIGPIEIESDGALISAIRIGGDGPLHVGTAFEVREAVRQLRAYFDGRLTSFSLPLKPAATARRNEIWRAMQAIGFGQVATYGDVARATASIARAVGQACRHNPLPIVIPCHRVLQAGYRLGPYSAGAGPDTKSFLLTHEAAEGWRP